MSDVTTISETRTEPPLGPWWIGEGDPAKHTLIADIGGLKVWGPPNVPSREVIATLVRHVPDMVDTLERFDAILSGEADPTDLPMVLGTAQLTLAVARSGSIHELAIDP